MYNFVFMLKTYRKDFEYVKRLIDTYQQYNVDDIPLYIVVPDVDEELFKQSFAKSLNGGTVICENKIEVKYAEEEICGISAGYINQEIVKLAFWKLGLCRNYLCLDSEAYFIREFRYNEFMHDDEIPYTVLIEDRDLKSNSNYYHEYWIEREKKIEIIQKEMQYETRHLLTCHGFQTFSCCVLEDMEQNFMKVKGYSYLELIKRSPYEFSWYNIWLQKSQIIPIYSCEPHFKTYHLPMQQFEAVVSDMDESDLKRGYVGIILQSNYLNGKFGLLRDIESLPVTLESNRSLEKITFIVIKSYVIRNIKILFRKFKG